MFNSTCSTHNIYDSLFKTTPEAAETHTPLPCYLPSLPQSQFTAGEAELPLSLPVAASNRIPGSDAQTPPMLTTLDASSNRAPVIEVYTQVTSPPCSVPSPPQSQITPGQTEISINTVAASIPASAAQTPPMLTTLDASSNRAPVSVRYTRVTSPSCSISSPPQSQITPGVTEISTSYPVAASVRIPASAAQTPPMLTTLDASSNRSPVSVRYTRVTSPSCSISSPPQSQITPEVTEISINTLAASNSWLCCTDTTDVDYP